MATVKAIAPKDGGAGASHELTRLTNALKLKDKQLEEQTREITTLKSQVMVAQKALAAKEKDLDGAKDKATTAAGGAAASLKELDMAKADKRKLEGQVAELMRTNAKLRDTLARAGDKSPGIAQQVAALQSAVRTARQDGDKAGEEAKAQANLVRAKDRELERQAKKVEEAAAVLARNGELENMVKDLARQLEEARAENRTLNMVNRQREGDILRMGKELEGAKTTLAATQATLADTTGTLKATTGKANDLEAQVGLLRDELARTGAVAARVAAAEIKNGSKDEGTVPVMQYLEECKYLNGEISRLKDKVAALEKELSVAHELKERYRTASESGNGLPPAGSRRVSSTTMTAGDITQRTRRSSAPGLPNTGAAAALFAGIRTGGNGSILSTTAQQPAPVPKAAFGRAATPTSPRRRAPSVGGDARTPSTSEKRAPSPVITARPRTGMVSPMRRSPSPMKASPARPATAPSPTKVPGGASIMAAINSALASPRPTTAAAASSPASKPAAAVSPAAAAAPVAASPARPEPEAAPVAAAEVVAEPVAMEAEQPAGAVEEKEQVVQEDVQAAVAADPAHGSPSKLSVDAPAFCPKAAAAAEAAAAAAEAEAEEQVAQQQQEQGEQEASAPAAAGGKGKGRKKKGQQAQEGEVEAEAAAPEGAAPVAAPRRQTRAAKAAAQKRVSSDDDTNTAAVRDVNA